MVKTSKYLTEIQRYHPITIPASLKVVTMKKTLGTCFVKLTRCKEKYEEQPPKRSNTPVIYYDMPFVGDEEETKPKSAQDLMMLARELQSTPNEDPTSCLSMILTQLTLLQIQTRQCLKFAKTFADHKGLLTPDILASCASALKQLGPDEGRNFFEAVCEDGSCESEVASIMIAILTESVKEGDYQAVFTMIFNIVKRFEISLVDDDVSILDPCANHLSTCFLITQLMMNVRGVEQSVDFLTEQPVVVRFLNDVHQRKHELDMYTGLLVTIFRSIYSHTNWDLALRLMSFNLDQSQPLSDCVVWMSLGFATVVEGAPSGDILKLNQRLHEKRIVLPDCLQRVAYVKVYQDNPKLAHELFVESSAYTLCTSFSNNSRFLPISCEWINAEIEAALKQACCTLKNDKTYNRQLSIQIRKETFDENCTGLKSLVEKLTEKYLTNADDTIQRLHRVLNIMGVRLEPVNDTWVTIPPSSLRKYLNGLTS